MTISQFRFLCGGAVLLIALAPSVLSPFSITLLNYIGIYALAVLGLVLLSGIGGMPFSGRPFRMTGPISSPRSSCNTSSDRTRLGAPAPRASGP